MKNWLLFLCLLEARNLAAEEQSDSKQEILPPCSACNTLVTSFTTKAAGKSDFKAVKDATCSEVTRGEAQCKQNLNKWENYLKSWTDQNDPSGWTSLETLRDWLCIQKLHVCCPPDHYGPGCQPCTKKG